MASKITISCFILSTICIILRVDALENKVWRRSTSETSAKGRKASHPDHPASNIRNSNLVYVPPGNHMVYECASGELFLDRCSVDERIRIVSGTYGKRKPGSQCMRTGYVTGNVCTPFNTTDSVGILCNGNATCNISVNHDEGLGDPCDGQIKKCVNVVYSCGENGEMYNECQCENETLSINCTNDDIIIRDAVYSASNERCASQPICSTINFKRRFKQQCDGEEECQTTVNPIIMEFGAIDKCLESYLEVEYACVATEAKPRKKNCSNPIQIIQKFAPKNGTAVVYSSDFNVTSGNCNFTNGTKFQVGVHSILCLIDGTNCSFQLNITKGRCFHESTYTDVGDEMVERCPLNSKERNRTKTYKQCIFNETSETGGTIDIRNNDCGEDETPAIDELSLILVTEDNVEDVAEVLSSVIESAEEIDIEVVQKTIGNIVGVQSSSPKVTEGVIESMNHILDANISDTMDKDKHANSSSMILQLVEQQIEQTILEYGQFESIKPNIVVEGLAVNASEVEDGISFEVVHSDSGFMEGKIQVAGISSVELPPDIFSTGNVSHVSFIGYDDDTLFLSEKLGEENTTMEVFGPIISAVVIGQEVNNTENPIVINFKPSQDDKLSAVQNKTLCVSWDFSLRDGIGDWSDVGCELVSADSGSITCQCNHLTNFAVLVDFAGQHQRPEPGSFGFVLDVISKVGCAVSAIALFVTLLIFFLCSKLRISLQRKILIHFCISMLGLYLTFLFGIDAKSQIGCFLAGSLLHYFVLTTMFWMGAEARHMYISLVSNSDRAGRKFMRKACIFSWGGALIPVGVVLAVKQEEYLAGSYCFIDPDYGLYFGLLLPVAVVMLHNIITFALVAKILMSSASYAIKPDVEEDHQEKTDEGNVGQRLLNAFSVSIIFGITWVFGFLAVEEARKAFQLLFCIFNSFQGVLIFILFCYVQRDVRRVLQRNCCTEPQRQPRVKKPNKHVDNEGKPLPVNTTTSMSDSTRVSGESYSDDGETLVTKFDETCMPLSTMESTQVAGDTVESSTIKAEDNHDTLAITDESESTLVRSETDKSDIPILKP